MPSIRILAAAAASVTLLLAGCATPTQSGSSYNAFELRRPMSVQMATVQALREVRIERPQQAGPGLGSGAGAVVGGVAGSNIGQGRGAIIGTVIGAVAGAVGGSFLERGASAKTGVEVTVRTDDGQTFAIVQEAGDDRFAVGQRVRVLRDPSTGQTRVSS